MIFEKFPELFLVFTQEFILVKGGCQIFLILFQQCFQVGIFLL